MRFSSYYKVFGGVSGSGLWDFPAIIRCLEGLEDRAMGSAPNLFRPIPGGLAF